MGYYLLKTSLLVTSFTLVWIKIRSSCTSRNAARVTSFTLVWIKICPVAGTFSRDGSRASRSCGLKYLFARQPLGVFRHELHARVD